MAKKVNLPAKKDSKKPTKKNNKKMNIFSRIIRFFKDVISELKKVTWPTRKNLVSYTIAVLVFVAIMMGVIYLIDNGMVIFIEAVFG